jgi:hypothetical protein
MNRLFRRVGLLLDTPVAVLARWSVGKRGMIEGITVGPKTAEGEFEGQPAAITRSALLYPTLTDGNSS